MTPPLIFSSSNPKKHIERAKSPLKELLIFAAWTLNDKEIRESQSVESIVKMCQEFDKDTVEKEIELGFHLGNEGIYLNKAALYPKRFFHFLGRAIAQYGLNQLNPKEQSEKEKLIDLFLSMAKKFAGNSQNRGAISVGQNTFLNFSITTYFLSMGYFKPNHPDYAIMKEVCQIEWNNNLAHEKILDFPLDIVQSYVSNNQYKEYKNILLSLFLTASLYQEDYKYIENKHQYYEALTKDGNPKFGFTACSGILSSILNYPMFAQEVIEFIVTNKGVDYLAERYKEIREMSNHSVKLIEPARPQIEKILLEHNINISIRADNTNIGNGAFKV